MHLERKGKQMDNIITIRLKEAEDGSHNYNIKFESNPTASELVASWLILQEVLEHNFDRQLIYTKMNSLYSRIKDIEEVIRQ